MPIHVQLYYSQKKKTFKMGANVKCVLITEVKK